MARRRRAVERATLRQLVADRIIVILLAVVAASGLMSLLPGSRQAAVSRFACQLGSLGLSSCDVSSITLGTQQLGPPRCAALATLDEALPEVSVSTLISGNGLPVEIDSARSGTTFVRVGTSDDTPLPLTWAGESRATREVLTGAEVPGRSEWVLPSAEGTDAIVDALDQQHRRWVERRSAIALVSGLFGGDGTSLPPPTTLYSQLELGDNLLPHIDLGTSSPPPTGDHLVLSTDRPAGFAYDRTTQSSSVVADLTGEVSGSTVGGSVRWTRDGAGQVSGVLIAVVSTGSLTVRDRNPASTGTEIGYLSVPVRTAAEQALVEAWLSDPAGFQLRVRELLDLKAPKPTDQLISYLTRAATITVLRYDGLDPALARDQVRDELLTARRTERAGSKLIGVSQIEPQPGGNRRSLVTDPTCLAG